MVKKTYACALHLSLFSAKFGLSPPVVVLLLGINVPLFSLKTKLPVYSVLIHTLVLLHIVVS